jgi:putative membrane protein
VHWLSLPLALTAAHVLANVVWIGSLLAVALLASRAPFSADPAEVGTFARRVHVTLAVPGFLLGFAAGLARLLLAPGVYVHLPWMRAKLWFALGVIVLHHVIGSRARRVANGQADAGRGMGTLAFLVFACAAGAVLLGVAKSLP